MILLIQLPEWIHKSFEVFGIIAFICFILFIILAIMAPIIPESDDLSKSDGYYADYNDIED